MEPLFNRASTFSVFTTFTGGGTLAAAITPPAGAIAVLTSCLITQVGAPANSGISLIDPTGPTLRWGITMENNPAPVAGSFYPGINLGSNPLDVVADPGVVFMTVSLTGFYVRQQ